MEAAPLTGVRVLELAHTLAGPLTGMHLADMGASVVRIEPPGGDPWRHHERVPGDEDRSRHHLQVNRGKRSVCLDLADAGARAALGRLIDRADVLVTNAGPGVAERRGFGWEECRTRNPRLVYCAITAYGRSGPRADRRGYDLQAQALTGAMRPGPGGPVPVGIPLSDTALPLLAGMAILAALLERATSGRGQLIDANLVGAALALNAHVLVRRDGGPRGASTFSHALHRAYATRDGWIAVAAYHERPARRLCAELGLPDLLDDPRFADRAERARNDPALAALIEPAFLARTTAEWDQRLGRAGVPAAPVGERDAVLDDPLIEAEGHLAHARDPRAGRLTMLAPATRFSRTPSRPGAPGRHIGADTRQVLTEAGVGAAEIERLLETGAARQPHMSPGADAARRSPT